MSVTIDPNTLIKKVQNINITKYARTKGILKSVKIPQKAHSFDFVELTDKTGTLVKIVTFRDKAKINSVGKIIKRYIYKEGKENVLTERTYIPLYFDDVADQDGFCANPVKARKISTVNKSNRGYINKSEEIQAITYTQTPILHISKINSHINNFSSVETESQSFFSYQKDKAKKGYEFSPYRKLKATFFSDFEPCDVKCYGLTNDIITYLQNDRYLPIHLYSLKQFKRNIPQIAQHGEYSIKHFPRTRWRNDMSPDCLSRAIANCSTGEYSVDYNDKILQNRYEIVNTVAHQNRHAYETEQINNYFINCSFMENYQKAPYPENLKLYIDVSKKYPIHDQAKTISYIQECKNAKYKPQYMYQDKADANTRAKYSGLMATLEYMHSVDMIKDIFPYAPEEMFGATLMEKLFYMKSRNRKEDMECIRKCYNKI